MHVDVIFVAKYRRRILDADAIGQQTPGQARPTRRGRPGAADEACRRHRPDYKPRHPSPPSPGAFGSRPQAAYCPGRGFSRIGVNFDEILALGTADHALRALLFMPAQFSRYGIERLASNAWQDFVDETVLAPRRIRPQTMALAGVRDARGHGVGGVVARLGLARFAQTRGG